MLTLRRSEQRGQANFGWLDSKHTFSFGSYYDPAQMGFSALRVINDDLVKPSAGFDTHGHRNMEIISYVTEGTIEHKDSEGNIKTLPAGEFQLMSAGKGIYHSEYNASATVYLNFLQIWIEPKTNDNEPSYQQKDFGKKPGITPIVTPSGKDNTLSIHQDASLYQVILNSGESVNFESELGRKIYIHQVNGSVSVDGTLLVSGDGAKIEQQNKITLLNYGEKTSTALIFDLP